MKKIISNLMAVGFIAFFAGSALAEEKTAIEKVAYSNNSFPDWKSFHSFVGGCSISFPETPEHVTQKMSLEDEEYDMQYDVYVSSEKNKESVFMVLIAQYPPYVTEEYADLSLESFLNGILTQHPNNQLISADLIQFQGHKAMDFFIKTKGVCFKGRAIMVGSHLYLLAMECPEEHFHEGKFNFFISSFKLGK